jgi:hypothetical protein
MERGLVDEPQDGSPEWDEVEQRDGLPEIPIPAVPVHVDGPVQTHQLPPRTSVFRTITVGAVPTELLARDLRRQRAYIYSFDQDILVALRQSEAGSAAPYTQGGARWPKGVALPLNGSAQVWVSAVTGTSSVTVVTESWAD